MLAKLECEINRNTQITRDIQEINSYFLVIINTLISFKYSCSSKPQRLSLVYHTPSICKHTQILSDMHGVYLFKIPQSSIIANNNIVQDIAATVYLNFVYERSNWANSSGWSSVLPGVIQHRSAIYISVRWCGLYNTFFFAFYSKQVSIMIYFYLNVFGSKDSNLSFHKKQLPIIAACGSFGWMFFMHWQAVYNWKILSKKENTSSK